MAFVKLADNYTDLIGKFAVALLAEGVDRNKNLFHQMLTFTRVALLAEGVDRNSTCSLVMGRRASSPSSRRAWIEIPWRCSGT